MYIVSSKNSVRFKSVEKMHWIRDISFKDIWNRILLFFEKLACADAPT